MSNHDDDEWQELKDYYADDDNWVAEDIDDEDYADEYENDVYRAAFVDGYAQAMHDMKLNNVINRLVYKMRNWWHAKRHPMDDIPF